MLEERNIVKAAKRRDGPSSPPNLSISQSTASLPRSLVVSLFYVIMRMEVQGRQAERLELFQQRKPQDNTCQRRCSHGLDRKWNLWNSPSSAYLLQTSFINAMQCGVPCPSGDVHRKMSSISRSAKTSCKKYCNTIWASTSMTNRCVALSQRGVLTEQANDA